MARDRHCSEGVHASPAHIRTERMPESVVGHARQPRIAAGFLERGRDYAGIVRPPVARHEHIAADVPRDSAEDLRQPIGERTRRFSSVLVSDDASFTTCAFRSIYSSGAAQSPLDACPNRTPPR